MGGAAADHAAGSPLRFETDRRRPALCRDPDGTRPRGRDVLRVFTRPLDRPCGHGRGGRRRCFLAGVAPSGAGAGGDYAVGFTSNVTSARSWSRVRSSGVRRGGGIVSDGLPLLPLRRRRSERQSTLAPGVAGSSEQDHLAFLGGNASEPSGDPRRSRRRCRRGVDRARVGRGARLDVPRNPRRRDRAAHGRWTYERRTLRGRKRCQRPGPSPE